MVKICLPTQEKWGSIPELGRSPGGGNGNPSILAWEIPSMELQRVGHDGPYMRSVSQSVQSPSRVRLFATHGLTRKCICIHSSTLAWKIPWTEEPGGLQSMGSLRVGYD